MSTPTINTAATQGLARVVTNLDDQIAETPSFAGLPALSEVLGLAERMRIHAGPTLEPVLDRLWAASDAIDRTLGEMEMSGAPADLLDLDVDQVADRFRDSAQTRAATMLDPAGYSPVRRAWETFTDALARQACAALKEGADVVVQNLRADFDRHLKVITTAAKAGISEHTDPSELLASGSTAQIAAFRALPESVGALDQIAGLRNQMTGVLRYGPPVHPVHSFITGLTSTLDAEGYAGRFDGTIETVQYNQPFNGSAFAKVQARRLGGRWLSLATYPNATTKLHLNSAAEVQTQYDGLA